VALGVYEYVFGLQVAVCNTLSLVEKL
jgi:hypothetical protein